MANITALSTLTTGATALSNLLLVTPNTNRGYQPQVQNSSSTTNLQIQPPPTFLFDYEAEQFGLFESDITDHFTENNNSIEDQIALKPEMITTSGFIAELNDISPIPIPGIQAVPNKLTTIEAYVPQLTTTALLAYNQATFLTAVALNAANNAVSSWETIQGEASQNEVDAFGLTPGTIQNKQQAAFAQLYGYWSQRTLFTIQTPWALFSDMAILSLKPVQSGETRVITNFEITFKRIRFASTDTVQSQEAKRVRQGRLQSQASSVLSHGNQSVRGSDADLLTTIGAS